jgi:hypothetical protein
MVAEAVGVGGEPSRRKKPRGDRVTLTQRDNDDLHDRDGALHDSEGAGSAAQRGTTQSRGSTPVEAADDQSGEDHSDAPANDTDEAVIYSSDEEESNDAEKVDKADGAGETNPDTEKELVGAS